MPRYELLSTATLMGIRSMAAVTSSCAVIWKQPSPSTAHTVLPGMPTLAPMAAGTEKPMVPRPPELIQVYGSSNFQYCEDHIWCWPTPDTRIVPGGALSRSCSRQNCGLSASPGSDCSYVSGYFSCQPDSAERHGVMSTCVLPAES